MNETRRSRRSGSRAHCSDETSEKGASRASVAAARRKGVSDAIFVHGVASRAPSARAPATVHYFRAVALDEELGGARMPVGQEDVRACGEGCHLEVLNWAREHGCPTD